MAFVMAWKTLIPIPFPRQKLTCAVGSPETPPVLHQIRVENFPVHDPDFPERPYAAGGYPANHL